MFIENETRMLRVSLFYKEKKRNIELTEKS